MGSIINVPGLHLQKLLYPQKLALFSFTKKTCTAPKLFANACNFAKQPEKILFHLGTNDLDYAPPDEIASKMSELLNLARSRCPQTKIYISAVLPRQSRNMADIEGRIEFTNTAYGTLTSSMPGCFLINHNINIHMDMLSDDRHLNKIGFYTLLANIRFFMFNILPRSRRSR